MFVGLRPINQSKLRRSDTETSRFFMPLLRSWADWEMDFAIHIAPNSAFNPPLRWFGFSTEQERDLEDRTQHTGFYTQSRSISSR
jgi:hypothetical protein